MLINTVLFASVAAASTPQPKTATFALSANFTLDNDKRGITIPSTTCDSARLLPINFPIRTLSVFTTGALPVPINIVEERTVGPDLGRDSINSGKTSLMVGFLLVILYMIFKYKYFGLIANISLITNLLMLVGVLTLLEATLTLPGIAGIILTVGMAVDANVLIFERIKEELKTEKSVIHAFDIGYTKAKITVIDANVTTLIAAIILFFFGSGPVKGFAVTLGIGIITTLFSAYYLARHLCSILVFQNKDKGIKL